MKMIRLSLGFSLGLVLGVGSLNLAHAAFNVGDISGLTDQSVVDMVKTIGTGSDFGGYRPANSLGMLVGFEVGGEATLIQVPSSFGAALASLGNSATVPSLFPAMRIHAWKGLPGGIDIGGSWLSLSGVLIWSAMLQKAFLETPVLSFGTRVSYNSTKVDFISTSSFDVEAIVSTGLGVIFPYVSGGAQFLNGRMDFTGFSPTGTTTATLSTTATTFRLAFGLDFKLGFFHLVPQYTFNFGGANSFGAKAAISF